MPGTKEGGQAARDTNLLRYGEDFYTKIGSKGGKNSRGGGFGYGTVGKERARIVGALGGMISRRGKKKTRTDQHIIRNARIITQARLKALQEHSQMQIETLSQKHGKQRPW